MDDGVYVVSIEHLGKGFPVEDVHLIESKALARFAGFGSRDGAHAIDGHFAGIAQVVNDDDTVALVQQLHASMAPNEPGATRNENAQVVGIFGKRLVRHSCSYGLRLLTFGLATVARFASDSGLSVIV